MDPEARIRGSGGWDHGSGGSDPWIRRLGPGLEAGLGRLRGGRGLKEHNERKGAKKCKKFRIFVTPAPDPLKHCRLLMVFGSRSARFQEKCAFPHFSHFLALLVDLKQGNNKPR